MMRLSPIIKKDLEVRSRSFTLPMVIAALNTVLFVVGLMGSFGLVSRMKETSEALYGSFLNVYVLIALLDFCILLLLAPLFTASAIAGERETGTFDLLLTTNLSAADIVLEKLGSAVVSIGVVTLSTLPALLIPLIYGGVSLPSALGLLLAFLPELLLVLSFSMFASSTGNSVTRSIAISYAMTAISVVGFFLLALLCRSFSSANGNYFAYLLLLDPLTPVLSLIGDQVGNHRVIEFLFRFLKLQPDRSVQSHPVLVSMIVQLAASVGFLVLAILNIMPGRYRDRFTRKRR